MLAYSPVAVFVLFFLFITIGMVQNFMCPMDDTKNPSKGTKVCQSITQVAACAACVLCWFLVIRKLVASD